MGEWMDGWVMGSGWVMGGGWLAKWNLSMWSAVTGAEKCSGPCRGHREGEEEVLAPLSAALSYSEL